MLVYDDFAECAFTMLQCETNCRDLYERLQLRAKDFTKNNSIHFVTDKNEYNLVSPNFASYLAVDSEGECHFGVVTHDRYDKPLRWLPVSELLTYGQHQSIQGHIKNKAAWEYLKALPQETKIVLYWC
jgi:hypothetical protein